MRLPHFPRWEFRRWSFDTQPPFRVLGCERCDREVILPDDEMPPLQVHT